MKAKLKYLGIGFFIAGLLFTIAERYPLPFIESSLDKTSEQHLKQLEKDKNAEIAELKATIKKLQAASDAASNNEEIISVSEEVNESSESNTSEDIIYGTIYIYENVSLYDIGKQAEDLKLVSNGRELELFLSKREYARSIQKGQFELSSNMSLNEMAKILTGKQ